MKRRLMALLMALVLVLGTTSTVFASSSVGDNEQVVVEDYEVEWYDIGNGKTDWTVWIPNLPEVTGWIDIEADLFTADDQGLCRYRTSFMNTEGSVPAEGTWFGFSDHIERAGAGKYYVVVTAYIWGQNGREVIASAITDEAEYKVPAKQLAAPIAVVENGVLTFTVDKDVPYYAVEVKDMSYGTNGAYEYTFTNEYIYPDEWYMEQNRYVKFTNGGATISFDFAGYYEQWESDQAYYASQFGYTYTAKEHDFTLYVQAKTYDINTIASSENVKAGTYDVRFSATEILGKLDELTSKPEALIADPVLTSQAKGYLANTLSSDTFIAMMADPVFKSKVQAIEVAYAHHLKLPAAVTLSTSAAIDQTKVSIVGALLNATEEGQQLALGISDATGVVAPVGYANAVALDIKLFAGANNLTNLEVPVEITMPVPATVETENLVILHYHEGATEPTIIVPVVNADGTMTFAVDGFSTFIIANQVVVNASPKTGDMMGTTVVCGMLLVAASAVIVMRRKSIVK